MESFDGNDGVVEVTSGREVEGLLGWILGQLGGHWVGGASSRIRPQASCEKFPSGGKKSFLGQFWVKCVCVGGGGGKYIFILGVVLVFFFPAMAMGGMWRLPAWLALFCGEQQPNPIPLKKTHKKPTNHKKPT